MIELANTSCTSSAAPQRFFSRRIDHSTWPEWSPNTEWVKVEGPVHTGVRGTLTPKRGPKVRFTVAECDVDRVYTDVSHLPGAKLTFQHTAEPAEDR